jgi:hypothetical protein
MEEFTMKKELVISACLVLLLSVSGCKGIKEGQQEPVKASATKLILVGGPEAGFPDSATSELAGKLADWCKDPNRMSMKALDPVTLGFIATTGKYLFDKAQQDKLNELAALKKASTTTYSARQVIPAASLQNAQCAILVRETGEDKAGEDTAIAVEDTAAKDRSTKEGLVAVVWLNHMQGGTQRGFTFDPIYVAASNAAVYTKAPVTNEEVETPAKINVSIGIVVKAIGTQNDVPVLANVGTSAVSVVNVELDKTLKNACGDEKKPCAESELIPHVLEGDALVSFGMSITETGQIGFDFDQREAEIKAIKEAYGPVISSSITEIFGEDD